MTRITPPRKHLRKKVNRDKDDELVVEEIVGGDESGDEIEEEYTPIFVRSGESSNTVDSVPSLHPLIVSYGNANCVSALSHLSLSGGSMHMKGMKYKTDSGF